jgi:hypothetical protein
VCIITVAIIVASIVVGIIIIVAIVIAVRSQMTHERFLSSTTAIASGSHRAMPRRSRSRSRSAMGLYGGITIGDLALRLESAETRLENLQDYLDKHDRSIESLWTWLPWLYKLYNWISEWPSWPSDGASHTADEYMSD